MNELNAFYSERLPRYLGSLERMVRINSFTANPRGVAMLAQETAGLFAPLGFSAEEVPATDSRYGSHLFLSRRGRGGEKESGLLLVSHLDTVFPEEEERANDFGWREEGSRIYGPGIVDIKGGTVMMFMLLEGLASLEPSLFDSVSWLVALNAAEERGSADFSEHCLRKMPRAIGCLVFEAGKRSGSRFQLVTSRKGRFEFKIEVAGRGAHSGADHARGASAVTELARIVTALEARTDYDRTLTCNTGRIGGGECVNRVPHHAWAEGEVRSFDARALSETRDWLMSLSGPAMVVSPADGYRCAVRVTIEHEMPSWPGDSRGRELFEVWQGAGAELGASLEPEARGGLSDANYLAAALPTIDGLGPAGGNMHCSERSADGSKVPEYLEVDSLVPKAVLNFLAVRRLLRGA